MGGARKYMFAENMGFREHLQAWGIHIRSAGNSGLIRGTKFDHDMEKEFQRFLNGKTPDCIRKICKALGAEFADSNADLCAVFHFLPNYPVWLKIWFADEEFEASGKLYLSRSADHYLSMEDAVTVGEVLLSKLKIQEQEHVNLT